MKHILNDISQKEKNKILEQHSGGKNIETSRFRSLLESSMGNVKPLISEQQSGETSGQTQVVRCDMSKEGIKNVTPEMIAAPPFNGELMGYTLNGTFNGVNYLWDGMNVEGFPGIRGVANVKIMTENNKYIIDSKKALDANPNGVWVGFNGAGMTYACYADNSGAVKCVSLK
jgi:hypothetical protein